MKPRRCMQLIISLKVDKQNKIGGQKRFNFLRTQIYIIVPRNVVNMSLSWFKKYIFHWVRYEYDTLY